jgi:hypothetical protein
MDKTIEGLKKEFWNKFVDDGTPIDYERLDDIIGDYEPDAVWSWTESKIQEAHKDGILLMAKHLFSKVDTETWNNVIAKILDKHKIDFK